MKDSLERLKELALKATPGPWRWELNLKCKQAQLCGGDPKGGFGAYDLTVMDFVRWGMGGAKPRFRGNKHFVLHNVEDFAAVVPGREHHKDWFQTVDQPDANYIAACSPDIVLKLIEIAEAALDLKDARCAYGELDMDGAVNRLARRWRDLEKALTALGGVRGKKDLDGLTGVSGGVGGND